MNDLHEARDKIKLGSLQHRIIAALAKSDLDRHELKRESKTVLNMQEFRPLVTAMEREKWIIRITDDKWAITTLGLHMSVLLGPVPEKRTPRKKNYAELFERAEYVPTELGFTCQRQGAYDAFLLPSRIGNELHYPNGRVTPA